jgi:hypothetical protein
VAASLDVARQRDDVTRVERIRAGHDGAFAPELFEFVAVELVIAISEQQRQQSAQRAFFEFQRVQQEHVRGQAELSASERRRLPGGSRTFAA